MSRNTHTPFNFEPAATDEEVRDATLQYVRKISGFTKPSHANEEAFARAVDAVADASHRLLPRPATTAPPRGPANAPGPNARPRARRGGGEKRRARARQFQPA